MFTHILSSVIIAMVIVTTANSATPEVQPLWSATGFEQAESVIYDTPRNQLIVTNISGHPGEADGQGYLSLLDKQGKVINAKWVEGMDAPKGMGIHQDTLYVADLNKLHIVDLVSATLESSITVEGAMFLNDISVDEKGNVYISDFMAHKIYRYANGDINIWLEAEELSHPNGLLVQDNQLYIGNWGKGMREDFSTETLGSLISIDLDSKKITPHPQGNELGNLDGVVSYANGLIISDWISGKLHYVSDTERKVISTQPQGLADIWIEGNELYLPLMQDAEVISVTLR